LDFSGGVFYQIKTRKNKMTADQLHGILTLNMDSIPSECLFYDKLGRMIRDMRLEKNLTPNDVESAVGIRPADLRRYEDGMQNIEIFTLLQLLSFLEFPNSFGADA